jgi:hypothetical protein
MRFKPGLSLSQHEEPEKALTENGVEIYEHLTINHPDARGTK